MSMPQSARNQLPRKLELAGDVIRASKRRSRNNLSNASTLSQKISQGIKSKFVNFLSTGKFMNMSTPMTLEEFYRNRGYSLGGDTIEAPLQNLNIREQSLEENERTLKKMDSST